MPKKQPRPRPLPRPLPLLLLAALPFLPTPPLLALPPPTNATADFSALDSALYFANCKPHYPISSAYENDCPQHDARWWLDRKDGVVGGQRIHVITYLGHCAYLSGWREDSMKHVWSPNGLKNAAACLWILEALGENPQTIQTAANAGRAAMRAGEKQPGQTQAIKQIVPWPRLAELLQTHHTRPPRYYYQP